MPRTTSRRIVSSGRMAAAASRFLESAGRATKAVLEKALVGRKIVAVRVGTWRDDEIRAHLMLDDGREVVGPLVAEYDDEAGEFLA
ncbi:MAG: hypothetical protein SF051_05360 [Elusimicrobiota bacterium]|nr:hypothetical protein [Elusimicrobiota bacterium]